VRVRRALALGALALAAPLVVLGVEAQLARTGDRLDDEQGQRPRQRVVRPGPSPLHVVWLGDSTSTGVGAGRFEQSMSWRVAEGLTEGPLVLTVLGRSGDQVHEVLDHQLPDLASVLLPDAGAHVVLVSIGANDVTALTRRPTFAERYLEMVDRIEATLEEAGVEARVVLVGIPDIGTAPRLLPPLRQVAGFRGAQLDDQIARVARRRGLHHVELAERTSRTFSSDPDRYFAADEYHPSGDGHGVWAEAVLASLAP
jgi:lysophospholipase L1-like esterase